MIKADLHIHSHLSDGLGSPELLVRVSISRNLNVISITDHDTFDGSIRAAKYVANRKLPILVIPGAEIRVVELGDFLVYCASPLRIKGPLGNLDALIELADMNNCFVIPAHPLNVLMNGCGYKAFSQEFTWIECFNSWTFPLLNYITYRLANIKKKKCLASSDAHIPSQVGLFHTMFPEVEAVETADDFLGLLSRQPLVKLIIHYSIKTIKDRLTWSIYRNIVGRNASTVI